MPYCWMGTDLEVDLSCGTIEKRAGDAGLVRDYLTGKGAGAKILWDRVTPEVDALSPDNLFIISSGILTGTVIPGAGHSTVTYKSPITGIYCISNLGGFFGPELKRAGYDTLVVSGKSPTPVYLWINGDHVEIRDASHLWGKDPEETRQLVRQEVKNSRAQVICIGLAGENRVYNATVEHGTGDCAGRGGTGMVMGDKNLKAIAVYGTKDIQMADRGRLFDLSEIILKKLSGNRSVIVENSAATYYRTGIRWGDFCNFSGERGPELEAQIRDMKRKASDYMQQHRSREIGCFNCALRCKHEYRNPDSGYTFLKCAPYYPAICTQVFDPAFSVQFYQICNKYGLDIYAAGNMVAFAIDLYQRGILTKEDTDGMHLEWRNPEVALALIEKIAKREGIGDVLADGTYRAARRIGKGAEERAITVKKMDVYMSGLMHRHHIAFMVAHNDKADLMKLEGSTFSVIMHLPQEAREAYVREGWFAYPKELEKYLIEGTDETHTPPAEAVCQFKAHDLEQFALADATGICVYYMHFWMYPAISRALLAELLTAATGMDIDEAEATRIARRIVNLVRAYNVREGLRRKDDIDSIPKHVFERNPPAPEVKLDRDVWNKLTDRFYEIRGWDKEGIPTRQTLTESGLDYVIEDLERRGIRAS
ncbi:MAG: aldehyde dehydrogenase [Chloroflexi bacterium]|nr:aldehyde dehydrogenase [Chloroflexota bacterium]